MWCRVLLFVIAITCTFQREIIADIDDVLCVVILSGIQKDDLDVKLLEKLQRYVNIDDINNRKTIEKCIQRSSTIDLTKDAKQDLPIKTEQSNQNFSQINCNINDTIPVEEVTKDNENKINISTSEIDRSITVESHTTPSYENVVNLWITLNTTSHKDNEVKTTKDTEKGMTVKLPLLFEEDTKSDSQTTSLDLIQKMFESYISASKAVTTTTSKPTTTATTTTSTYQLQNQVDIVSRQITKILENNKLNNDKTFVDRTSKETQSELTSTRKVNYNLNEAMRDIYKSNDNGNKTKLNASEIEKSISSNTMQNPSLQNFINLWIKLNKTNYQDSKDKTTNEFEKSMTLRMPVTFDKETKIDPQATDVDLIHKLLNTYQSQQTVSNIKPTMEKQIDIVSQQIQTFLNNNQNTSIDNTSKDTNKNRSSNTKYPHDENSLMRKIGSLSNEVLAQKYQLNIPGPTIDNLEGLQKFENSRILKTRSNMSEQMPVAFNNDINTVPRSKYIEILKAYVAAKHVQTSTEQPTTTPKHIDLILQEIKEFLQNRDTQRDHKVKGNDDAQILENKSLDALLSRITHNNQDLFTRKSFSTHHNNEVRNQDQSSNLQVNRVKDNTQLQQMPIAFNYEAKADCHSKELDHIFHMFETYIATKDVETRTAVPTTTPRHIDVIAQKVKEYLESNDHKYRRVIIPAQNQSAKLTRLYNTDGKLFPTRKIDYMRQLQKQANQLKLVDISPITSELHQSNVQQSNNSQTVQNKVLTENNVSDAIKTELKPLPEDVIREITEMVKTSVLKDLQKQMSSTTLQPDTKGTTTKVTPTTKIVVNIHNSTADNYNKLVQRFKKESGVQGAATELPSTKLTTYQIDQNKIKTATNALENFMELFEKFKHVKDSITIPNGVKHRLTQKGKTKNEFHGPINVVYPSLLPLNYPYNVNSTRPVSSMPIFLHPYGLHINNPSVEKIKITNEIKKFQHSMDSLKNMKSKLEHAMLLENAMQAAVIQTDDVQVPLLGIPVPNSVSPINQNIIVTTKHPMLKFREDQDHRSNGKFSLSRYHDHTTHDHGKYDSDSDRQSDTDLGRQSDTYLERHSDTDITRHHSDLERNYGREHRNSRGRYSIPDYKKSVYRGRQSPRSKQASFAIDNFYQENLSTTRAKDGKLWDLPEFSQEHKRERFHEKLERPEEPRYRFRDRETPIMDKVKPMKVESRQQLPMHELKRNQSYIDTHYMDFLESQKKVNDMLEKILQSSDKVHSAEAI